MFLHDSPHIKLSYHFYSVRDIVWHSRGVVLRSARPRLRTTLSCWPSVKRKGRKRSKKKLAGGGPLLLENPNPLCPVNKFFVRIGVTFVDGLISAVIKNDSDLKFSLTSPIDFAFNFQTSCTCLNSVHAFIHLARLGLIFKLIGFLLPPDT
jgi:hypothetical protein